MHQSSKCTLRLNAWHAQCVPSIPSVPTRHLGIRNLSMTFLLRPRPSIDLRSFRVTFTRSSFTFSASSLRRRRQKFHFLFFSIFYLPFSVLTLPVRDRTPPSSEISLIQKSFYLFFLKKEENIRVLYRKRHKRELVCGAKTY